MESGVYKVEDDSYLYEFGGKIAVSELVYPDNDSVVLSLTETKDNYKIGEDLSDLTEDYFAEGKPMIYLRFYNKDSIQGVIDRLKDLKKILSKIQKAADTNDECKTALT